LKFSYRFYQSNRACLKSIFALHNETMNIWSHLIGFVFFAGLGVYAFNVSGEGVTHDEFSEECLVKFKSTYFVYRNSFLKQPPMIGLSRSLSFWLPWSAWSAPPFITLSSATPNMPSKALQPHLTILEFLSWSLRRFSWPSTTHIIADLLQSFGTWCLRRWLVPLESSCPCSHSGTPNLFDLFVLVCSC